jgi:hypothetical protein
MAKIRLPRFNVLQHAPYDDSESYNAYMDMMAQAKNESEAAQITELFRQNAMTQNDRIGSVSIDPDVMNYNRWSEYDMSDPNRPDVPALHSGTTTGGTPARMMDFRTDQYLKAAAKMGKLDNLNDPRSRAARRKWGGPLRGIRAAQQSIKLNEWMSR